MDWRAAFLRQAASDYGVAVLLASSPGVPVCHTLHYLQMAMEKFAKGILTPAGSLTPPSFAHDGALRLIAVLEKPSQLADRFHRELAMSYPQRRSYLRGLRPAVEALERLAPAVANRSGQGVNAEYPWVVAGQPAGTIMAPADFDFGKHIPPERLPKLLQLLCLLVRSFPSGG